jgi:hypothetical protein
MADVTRKADEVALAAEADKSGKRHGAQRENSFKLAEKFLEKCRAMLAFPLSKRPRGTAKPSPRRFVGTSWTR